jgi:two-component system response regulator AtoC
MSMIKSKVLVVDDEESIRNLMKAVLTREGREVLLSSQGRDAIEMFQRERPDITILDIAMPDLNGIEVLRRIRAFDQGATVMVFTGSSTEALVKQAQELGVTEVLEKGSSLSAIWEARTPQV